MWTLARPFQRQLLLLAITMANTGCVIILGDGTGNGTSGDGDTPLLPTPENAGEDPNVPLDPEQRKRQAEADALIASEIYGGYVPERSVRGKSGKIYDSLRIPPVDVTPPDVAALLPTSSVLEGVSLGMTELERYPELWGPAGTTVFVRPDFSKYIMDPAGATSIQDWIQNYQIPAIPDDPNRLYAGLDIREANVGVYARINAFKPEVTKGSLSVIELAVGCPAVGDATEFVGVFIGVDWANFHFPPTLDLSVERWRDVNGKKEGGFNEVNNGFVQEEFRPTDVGSPLEHYSVVGGEQWEHALLLLMAPTGSWWVVYNGQAIGHFPAALFTTLNKGACRAQVYGEVYNPHPEQGWVRTEMGSGQFSGTPQGRVAWIREIRYLDTNYVPREPPTDDVTHWSQPYHYPCYDRQPLTSQNGAGPTLTLGGPGGKDPVCAQWKPSP